MSDLQATSCSCRAPTGQQRLTMPGWWAPTCLQLKEPVWGSGPTDSPHVRKPAATIWIVWLELAAVIFDFCTRCAAADCRLNVWRLSEGKVHQLLAVRDLQEPWKRFSVDIQSTEEYQVPLWYHHLHCSCFNWRQTSALCRLIFVWCGLHCLQIVLEGIRGTAGFIGLDDIEYTVGVDCDKKMTDMTPGMMLQADYRMSLSLTSSADSPSHFESSFCLSGLSSPRAKENWGNTK